MEWQALYANSYERTIASLERHLKDITPEVLNRQPQPGANSIAWLAWHIARAQDRHLSDVFYAEQLYLKDGWYARFGRAPEPKDSGTGHTPEEAAAFDVPDATVLLDYHTAALDRSQEFILSLSAADIERAADYPGARPGATIGGWLNGMLAHSWQHLGEISYARGLLRTEAAL